MAEPTTAGDVAALLHEGAVALGAGDAYTARQHFRKALEIDPSSADAWVGMAGAVRPYRERRDYLQRAIEAQPDHPAALAALAEVDARLARGELLAPALATPREARRAAGAIEHNPLPPPPPEAVVPATPANLRCYIHPARETGLRCTSCERPICADCVRPAPVGQLCPECAKARRPVNYQVSWVNLLVAGVVTLIYGVVVTFLGLQVLGMARFFAFIVAFLIGPLAGNLLVRIVDRLTRNKRGRSMQWTVGLCYALGALPWVAALMLVGGGWILLLLGVFTVAAIVAAVTALR